MNVLINTNLHRTTHNLQQSKNKVAQTLLIATVESAEDMIQKMKAFCIES